MTKLKKQKWEESYKRKENHIFYPKEECVKFLNRYIRKKIGFKKFIDVYKKDDPYIRALDYGCGIGSNSILMEEFGIEVHAIDISKTAIDTARELASLAGLNDLTKRINLTKGTGLNFRDNEFDFVLCDSVLDSMHFESAKTIFNEFCRVAKKYIFISLISGNDSNHHREYSGDEIVETIHEEGTFQSYYNYSRIEKLINGTKFRLEWGSLISEESIVEKSVSSRYWLLFERR
jgi:2-polyprenyl-3-methyl-5-hydroxy-6-metoxy-1,4-benzoquinol methylase